MTAETKMVPVEPSPETVAEMVQFAMRVSLHGSYSWSDYMRDLYKLAVAASPSPPADVQDGVDAGRFVPLSILEDVRKFANSAGQSPQSIAIATLMDTIIGDGA